MVVEANSSGDGQVRVDLFEGGAKVEGRGGWHRRFFDVKTIRFTPWDDVGNIQYE